MNGSQETLYGVAIVADGDVDRGKEMAEALAGRGLSTRFAAHGAEALEAALADPPDVVVASLGLPLIDAPQLASILRANPRTQGARILVVGGGRDEASDHAAIDARLPGPASPEEVVRQRRDADRGAARPRRTGTSTLREKASSKESSPSSPLQTFSSCST